MTHPRSAPRVPQRPKIGSICTGYGGLDLAVMTVFGGRLVWCADPDPHVERVLTARFPKAPNLGDITGVDWTTVAPVDVITAGFPCQDISHAGKRAGITKGTRSGIWTHIADAIGILRPQLAFVENVAAIRTRGIDLVLADLATLGYDTRWLCLPAADLGAPHRRDRFFLAAWPATPAAKCRSPRTGSRPSDATSVRQPILHRPLPTQTTSPRQASQPR
jgi:DNA (cytosine-5)-methyltransferase 1